MVDNPILIFGGMSRVSLGLDDMEGDLSPHMGGGQVQGDKAVIGGDGWGGTYTLWGGPYFE